MLVVICRHVYGISTLMISSFFFKHKRDSTPAASWTRYINTQTTTINIRLGRRPLSAYPLRQSGRIACVISSIWRFVPELLSSPDALLRFFKSEPAKKSLNLTRPSFYLDDLGIGHGESLFASLVKWLFKHQVRQARLKKLHGPHFAHAWSDF